MGRIATPLYQPRSARPTGERMSYREFLERFDDGRHVEWINGEVVEMPPIGEDHDRLDLFLLRILGEFLEHHPLGEIRHDPFNMKTGPDLPGRAPDVLYVANKNLKRLKRTYLHGPADLVIEIVSPGSKAIDRGDKYYEYEQGGVNEYWLIDPQRKSAEFYRLDKKRKRYQLHPADSEGIYAAAVIPGFWIRERWLWYPFPLLSTVRREWGL